MDAEAGLALLGALGDPDPLAQPARKLRAQLLETQPALAQFATETR